MSFASRRGCCSASRCVPLLVLAYVGDRAAAPARGRRLRRAAPPRRRSSRAGRAGGATRRSRLAGLALAGLIVALARPQVTVAVPAEQASIVLDDGPLRLDAGDRRRARRAWSPPATAGEAFLEEVPEKVRVGGVVFDHRTQVDPEPDHRPGGAARRAARRR